MSKLIKIILIAAFLFVVVFLIVNQFILNKNLSNLKEQKLQINIQQENQEEVVSKEDAGDEKKYLSQNCMGVIEGSLMFPSEKIPSGMYVCARNIKTMQEYCSDQNIESDKFKYKMGYRLEVPSGQYVIAGVYPQGLGSGQIDKAMEFKYTKCNGDNCHNDSLLVFDVGCGKTSENINLFDGWRIDFFRRFFTKSEQQRLLDIENTK